MLACSALSSSAFSKEKYTQRNTHREIHLTRNTQREIDLSKIYTALFSSAFDRASAFGWWHIFHHYNFSTPTIWKAHNQRIFSNHFHSHLQKSPDFLKTLTSGHVLNRSQMWCTKIMYIASFRSILIFAFTWVYIHFHLFLLKPLQPPFTFISTFTIHPFPYFFPGRSTFTFSTFTFTFSTFLIPLHISIVIILLPWPGFTSQLSILNPILPAANSSNIGAAPE